VFHQAEDWEKNGVGVKVIDLYGCPFDEGAFCKAIGALPILTVEEHVLTGGIGSIVLEMLNDRRASNRIKRLGVAFDGGYPQTSGSRDYRFTIRVSSRKRRLGQGEHRMKKLLVCGATGFIGRNAAEYFAGQGEYEVFGTYLDSEPYSYPNINLTKADLTNPADVDRVLSGMDVVVQAAATTSGSSDIVNRPYYHGTDNAVMNSLILRSAFENKIEHFVFTSCAVMYQPGKTPVKESDFNASDEIYKSYFGVGWTKVYIEKMCEFYSRISDCRFTALRHSNVYGPYDKYDLEKSHVFGATITKVMTAPEGGEIVIWGEGKEKRDLIHVDDMVAAVDLAIKNQKEKFELVNIGAGVAVSISDLVEKIIEVSGKDLKMRYDLSKPTIPTELALDSGKAKSIYGWEHKISLEDGIRRTIDWYKENIM
jgi:nucleoside-diphosphate-sugar epimerase